jgi:type II secretory pathway pseudopilin PulG
MTTRQISTINRTRPTGAPGVCLRWSRRGISLIEVVMASTLLAVIASAVVASVSTVVAADSRNEQKLEALELGNRILLQYLDNKDALPDQSTQLTQGRGVYRWALRTSPVGLSMPSTSVIEKPADGPGAKAISKLTLVSVSVYAGVPDGMGGFTSGERLCTLSRVCHPLSTIYRNPDRMKAVSGDPAAMIRLFTDLFDDAPVDPASAAPRASARPSAPFGGARAPATSSTTK